MLPSTLSTQLHDGLAAFLRSSLWSSTPHLQDVAQRFLEEEGTVWKGPWVDVKLPFAAGDETEHFPRVPLGFRPHAHQQVAFQRLGGRKKLSTLVATGTGSGKTESFMQPILDHVLQAAPEPGVKAVLIYPMNALATDQALRFAKAIHGHAALKGTVRAGLYVGQDQSSAGAGHTQMGPRHLITDRDTLRDEPPDILLTNYKMLDYLLLRPEDARLWRHNRRGTLRFVVVDELHTFDGAQGTDLACLIRRLKRRLEADDGALCCVGTSATLGGEDAAEALVGYAEHIFGEQLDDQAVVTEQRLAVADVLGSIAPHRYDEPVPDDLETLRPAPDTAPGEWLTAQARLWLGDDAVPALQAPGEAGEAARVRLGELLLEHVAFHRLLRELDGGPRALPELARALSAGRKDWLGHAAFAQAATLSLVGLVSAARRWRHETEAARTAREARGARRPIQPFLEVRLQAWQRELARMVASLGPEPSLAYSDDLDPAERRRHLPLVRCADCGALGWGTQYDEEHPRAYGTALQSFYRAWFARKPAVRILFPARSVPRPTGAWSGQPVLRLDPDTLKVVKDGEEGFDEAYPVIVAPNQRTVRREGNPVQQSHQDCPFCGGADRLLIAGFRTATLASVAVDQLFGSRFNDDKRLLAFSDSVQDAAHRAGFLSARTWRTNLRLAIAQALPADGTPVPLHQLADRTVRHWRDAKGLGEVRFVAAFLPPDMAWLHDWDHVREHDALPEGSRLPDLVTQRMAWEVHGEAGLWAERGRSLERTGVVAVGLDGERLAAAVSDLLEPLRNEVPGLRSLDAPTLRRFLVGLLHGARWRGALFTPHLSEGFWTSGGNRFALRGQHLPRFGPRSRLPRLLADNRTEGFADWSGARSWYAHWPGRSLTPGALGVDAADLYPVLLPRLEAAGLLRRVEGVSRKRPFTAWGLRPEAWWTTRSVQTLVCDTCNLRHAVPEASHDRWHAMPCLALTCDGTLRPADRVPDYFAHLYAHGDLQRVYAEEHTGLLQRRDRESVEQRFKAPDPPPGWSPTPHAGDASDEGAERFHRPWDPNLLSCTPTLEMGIDVGDLSSTLLCGVPPAQANYLQRIGRAGRRDGNAFILTLANARPHDRYYWDQPEEMIDGQVDPPGLFLDASAVLERHLAAFCLDHWVAEGGAEVELPARLSTTLDAVRHGDEHRFPFPWFRHIAEHADALLRDFHEMFPAPATSPHTHQALDRFLRGGDDTEGGLRYRILALFEAEARHLDALDSDIRDTKREMKRLEDLPVPPTSLEEDLEALAQEKAALTQHRRTTRSRNLLEFLTDQGFLPNYAFPEAAVRLESVIWRRKKQADSKRAYDTRSFEYVRSPVSALGDLAPGADFYAGGRKVRIERLDIKADDVETWRFCATCSYTAPHTEAQEACPACGDALWADADQEHPMLRLSQVYAGASDRFSRITDDSDHRRPLFFLRDLYVAFDDDSREGSWALAEDKATFAFEFVRRARFTEVNHGLPQEGAPTHRIAGSDEARPGFSVCSSCGTVQRPGGAAKHTRFCKGHDTPEAVSLVEGLYLYRQLDSEALRILLPVSDLGDRIRLDSLLAGLHLGLRKRFGGALSHLASTVHSEPDRTEPGLTREHLVLYDTVPGGTGYLDELVRPDEVSGRMPLFECLQAAVEHIRACPCRQEGEDGCHRCVRGQVRSASNAEVRASDCLEVFDHLLDHESTLRAVDSLEGVSVKGLLESQLEARFLAALRKLAVDGRPVTVVNTVDGTRTVHTLQVGDRTWRIVPQVSLEGDGLGVSTRPDFLLQPLGALTGRKPIAVYLDGWSNHHERLGDDLAKRQLLVASGRYEVWSLTWYDLDQVLLTDPRPIPWALDVQPAWLPRLAKTCGLGDLTGLEDGAWLQVLVNDLVRPPSDAGSSPWRRLAEQLLLRAAKAGKQSSEAFTHAWAGRAPEVLHGPLSAVPEGPAVVLDAIAGLTLAARFERGAVHAFLCCDDRWDPDDDTARTRWWATLLVFQLWQSLDEGLWACTRATPDPRLADLVNRRAAAPAAASTTWAEDAIARDDLLDEEGDLGRALQAAGVPEPVFSHGLLDARGRVDHTAIMAWPDAAVALVDDPDAPAPGWTLLPLATTTPDDVLTALQDAGSAP